MSFSINHKHLLVILSFFICNFSIGQVLFEDFEGESLGLVGTTIGSVYQDYTLSGCSGSGTTTEIWQINTTYNNYGVYGCSCDCDGAGCANNRAVIHQGGSGCAQDATLLIGNFTGESSVDISFDWTYDDYDAGDSFVVELYNYSTLTSVATLLSENSSDTDNGTYGPTTFSSLNASHSYGLRFRYIGNYDYGAAVDNILVTSNCTSPTGTFTVSPDCGNSQFYIDVNVTNLGSGSDVDITNNGGVAATSNAGTGTTTIGPFAYSTNVIVTIDGSSYGGCTTPSTSLTEDCSCTTPPTGTVGTTNLNCGTNTFDIQVTGINNGSGTATDIYVNGVLDVAGSELLGKAAGTIYTVTLKATGSGSLTCETDYTGVSASCATPCAGSVTPITDGYTQSNITTPGSGGVDDWVGEAESCGTAAAGEFEDSDVKIYSYTTGNAAGESFYFTIEYNYSADQSHSIGVWENCTNDSLTNCITSYYNFDDVAGVCVQGLAANTTYYIAVSNNYFSTEALDFDIIDFTVETATTIPEDECINSQIMSITSPYDGSTRCSYTTSSGSPGGCGTIENDSWIAFVADSTTAIIDYSVSNCSNEWGVQLSVWSGTCGSLTMLSGSCINYAANNSTGTWTLSGMVIGQTYYIRADGYAGDLCGYSYTPIGGILPVTLTDFSGKALQNGYNQLNWTTSSEINNDYFSLEKSVDGINFESFATQSGAGNSNGIIRYLDYDNSEQEITYYRLKQIDFDGNYSYSDIISIANSNSAFKIYPNPSKDGYIKVNNVENVDQIKVLDIQGRILKEYNTINANTLTLDLNEYKSGLYYISITTLNKTVTEKIVIQK